jgi:tight adherence protein C
MLFAAGINIDLADVTPFAIFGLVAAGAWWIMDRMAAGNRAVERLAELKTPRRRQSTDALLKKSAPVTKVLEKAAPSFVKPKSAADKNKLKAKLTEAGFRSENATAVFLSLKFFGLLGGLLFAGSTLGVVGLNRNGMVWSAAFFAMCFYLPDVAVGWLRKRRTKAMFLALPDALDLMVVCVEAGLGLDQAMRKISEEMKKAHPVLAAEMATTNMQLQMGRPRAEALHELGMRSGLADLRALVGVLVQADRFGSSIAQALRVQSDSMRTRRRQLAEEKAAKTAVKLIFPLVMFIFPGIFVILVGPAALIMMRDMFPKMAGH